MQERGPRQSVSETVGQQSFIDEREPAEKMKESTDTVVPNPTEVPFPTPAEVEEEMPPVLGDSDSDEEDDKMLVVPQQRASSSSDIAQISKELRAKPEKRNLIRSIFEKDPDDQTLKHQWKKTKTKGKGVALMEKIADLFEEAEG